MKKLFNIFNIIEKENIILEEIDLTSASLDGIYIKIPHISPTIGINKSIVNNSRKCISILSEELGHHFTTFGNLTKESLSYSHKLIKNKKELKARLWAANFLISDKEFVQALNDCITSIPEMADYFNVTEEIIVYKIYSVTLDEPKYKTIRNNFMQREIPYNSCVI
ncbi:ImmA/IrrE family metallo-endopeptidase [Clostridium botulinum]|nr:ImmA/IrrE family metallo-endopeptidase [Clostridium botulinum]NFI17065.1 ImmA/IrrE family metallo-endopeptidase [Clostridium botulinum]NFL91999.1 ImmA/IrrE family metallo-endopeptidase [Clostridium botulinum]NFN51270.1 ImmA/IrrE family metallo-endopeptidase [Clostridium botulinum]NFO26479.1 ImmA/IrrE family metallo-endopeptidase [Clostridium botulinum]